MDIAIWLPATITGIVTVAVCLINNHYSVKASNEKNLATIEEKFADQQKAMRDNYSKQNAQIEDMIAHNEESIAIIETQISNLKNEVEKHNQIVERVFVLEGRAERFCEISSTIRADVSDLKRNVEKLGDKLS